MPVIEVLRHVELFRGLTDAQLDRIGQISTLEIHPRGNIIFEQGAVADKLYVIGAGQVEIAVTNAQGERYPAVYLGAGQIVGEMGLVDAGKRSAAAIAVEEQTQVYCIDALDFQQLCEQDTAIGYLMMRNIAQDLSFKLRHTDSDNE
jgi:CRP/FNR family transcriptional regulator, cyclic AMP receptor protein